MSEKQPIKVLDTNPLKDASKSVSVNYLKQFLDKSDIMEDTIRVNHFLSNKRKSSKKADTLTNLGISGAIPTYEKCLKLCCKQIILCYKDNGELKRVKSCKKLADKRLKKLARGKYVCEITPREIGLIFESLEKSRTNNKESNERLDYLLSKITDINNYQELARVII